MEYGYENNEENIYFACRKRAAKYNEKLNSRESAAELLGISTSTLANHELGVTKNVPVDTVVMMADLYRAPELKYSYCKNECPIGRYIPLATKPDSLQCIAIRILHSLDDEQTKKLTRSLINIAAHTSLTEDDRQELAKMMESLDTLSLAISELRMLAENVVGRGSCDEPEGEAKGKAEK